MSMEVFIDCADLACTRQRLDAAAHAQAARRGLRPAVRAALGHLERRPPLAAVRLALDAQGRDRNAGGSARGIDGDVPGKPFGGREDYAFSPDGRHVAFSVRVSTTARPGPPISTSTKLPPRAASRRT